MLEDQDKWYYNIVYFFIANQILIKRLLVVVFILINIIIWGIAGVGLVNYISDSANYSRVLNSINKDLINWDNVHQSQAPQTLEILSINKIAMDDNKYDLVAEVYNPNQDWFFDNINYAFVIDGYVTDWQTDFILPGQTKYLLYFSHAARVAPRSIDIKIQDGGGHRISSADQARISLLDGLVVSGEDIVRHDGIVEVSFTATNNSYFSFWQLGWQVILYNASRPIGVNYITISNFLNTQSRQVSVVWDDEMSIATRIKVVPDVNIFDDENYIVQPGNQPVNLIRGAFDQAIQNSE